MNRFNTHLYRICIVLFLCFHFCTGKAQAPVPNTAQIISQLTEYAKKELWYDYDLVVQIAKSGQSEKILRELQAKATNHYLRTRVYVINAAVLFYEDTKPDANSLEEYRASPATKTAILALLTKAMNEAYLSGDERLIAQMSFSYGHTCHTLGQLEFAVTYLINGLELNEKLGIENSPKDYIAVGEIFYKIREYGECVKNSTKAFHLVERGTQRQDTIRMMFSSNTAALGYHRQQQYDSAFFWYQTSLKMATALKLNVWNGIIGGNMGQIYYEQKKYDTALVLFQTDTKLSKEEKLYDNAANSLQWAARTQLRLGNTATALQNVREAFSLLERTPEMFYLRNTYYAATDAFKTMGLYDSAFYYNAKYAALNDSLERVIALSGIAVSKARANDEKSRYSIQSLLKEKEKQVFQRNILLAAIVLLGILGFLAITHQRLKAKLQVERMEQEKKQMEQEIASAREQLNMFTENMLEKTNLIEKLEERLNGNSLTTEQHMMVTELCQQTILTEEDWLKFKSLFDKIYPSFFQKLKNNASDITIAEQRMAALTRMQLTSKQTASMLGISIDSVHKTRQRLRQRLQLGSDNNLDEYIAGI